MASKYKCIVLARYNRTGSKGTWYPLSLRDGALVPVGAEATIFEGNEAQKLIKRTRRVVEAGSPGFTYETMVVRLTEKPLAYKEVTAARERLSSRK